MNRSKLETLLLTLESTPALLARAASECPPSRATWRPRVNTFSLVENVWHLADLEREGFGSRIRRLLTEEAPMLPNFDGNRVASERGYQGRSLAEGIAAFALARHRNVERLRAVPAAAWKRAGFQESVGPITLADIPQRMADHDRSHTEEIRSLLAGLRGGEQRQRPGPTSAVA